MIKKKILVIDDNELVVKMISDILVCENYDVVVAGSGEEGLKKVEEERPDLVLLDVVLPKMNGFEVCKILRGNEETNLIPIIMLTSEGDEDKKITGLELGADDYIVKPFNPRELVSRVRNTLTRIDRNRYVNPLTGLPGNIEIQSEVDRRINSGMIFSMIYADLDNFKAYNDVYGFAYGDKAIKLLSEIIVENVHLHGTAGDFIGHIGGDDFIIITVPKCVDNICKNIIECFDSAVKELYNKKDLENGYITTTDRSGRINKFPIMSVSLAVVSNENRKFDSYLHISEVAAEVKRVVKSISGSAYFKDRRRSRK
mgnify:CR=1 FL=1